MLRQVVQAMGSSWRRESASPDEWRFYIQSQMNGDFSNKNGGKQSFNAPFSASHLEKTRISASDFASQSRTNEKPPVVRRGGPKRMQNRRASSPCPPRHPSRTLPTNEWRKFIRFRNEWRKLAHYSAGSLPQTHADPPFVLKRKKTASRRETRRLPAANSRRPTPDRPREAHSAALAITKRTNTCQPLAIGQSAGCIAAARHRSKWRAAA